MENSKTPLGEEVAESVNNTIVNNPVEVLPAINKTFNSPNTFTESAKVDNFSLLSRTAGSLEDMKSIANELIRSSLCPLKKAEDVILAIITGNQYDFPFMTSINNIYPVNGKPSMSAHLIRALLLKNKIIFSKVLNFEPVYQFAKVDESGWVTKESGGKKVPIFLNIGTIQEQPLNSKPFKEVDRITKYTFSRLLKQEDGSFEKLLVTSEYKMSEAVIAGLADKDNWQKHPPRMLDARAFTIGAREIASDILLGVYAINELADDNNIKYTINASLEEEVINQ